MIRSVLVVLFIAIGIGAIACADGNKSANVAVNTANSSAPPTPLPSVRIDELASGRKLYADNCAGCHKDNGTGGEVTIEGKTIKPDDLTSAKIKAFSDEKTLGYIMNGVEDEGMPAFKGKLSEGEMRDVLKFVRVELQKMPAPEVPKS